MTASSQTSICDMVHTPLGRYGGALLCVCADDLGGAIALGHPLGVSRARLITMAVNRLHITEGRYVLYTTCIGVGQDVVIAPEHV